MGLGSALVKLLVSTILLLIVLLSLIAGVLYFNENLREELGKQIFNDKNFIITRKEGQVTHKFNPQVNRRWLLKSRPVGAVSLQNFEYKEEARPKLKPGQILVLNKFLSFDPTQRGWISRDTYRPAIPLGQVVEAAGVGEVVESKHPNWPVGSVVNGLVGWEDFTVLSPDEKGHLIPPVKIPLKHLSGTALLNTLTDLTAIAGIVEVGKVKPGDVVLVSGAAGATGSIAGQAAKLMGAKKVIGIAGGATKKALLTSTFGFDAAIDYKNEDVAKRVAELVGPAGLDVFFDNVGGEQLEIALAHLAHHARVVICGAISQYEAVELHPIKGTINLLLHEASMEGFLVMRFMSSPATILRWLWWSFQGKLVHLVDMHYGFDTIPETFLGLFKGTNTGKLLLELDH